MKLLSQFLALHLPAARELQVMASIAILVIFLKMLIDKLPFKRWWETRRKNREIEGNMWAIE
jgi:hypothetical protein